MKEIYFVLIFIGLSFTHGYENEQTTIEQVDGILRNSIPAESRIVAGWEAQDGQIPFHVSLRMVNSQGNQGYCGGSLIHHKWVLTAAHCVALRLTFIVRMGTVNNTRPLWMTETSRKYMPPGYIEEDITVQTHDIGLIELEHHIPYGDLIKPVRLQSSAQRNYDYTGEVFTVSGYGYTNDLSNGGLTSEVLLWVHLRGISEEECLEWYPNSTVINEHTLCAEYYNDTAQSPCNGDSGGPLTILDNDGVVTQIGIVSFRSDLGCNSSSPTGYVRPGQYHDWLTEVTGINFDWNYGDDAPAETPYPGIENPNYSMLGGTPTPLGTVPSMIHILSTIWSDSSTLKRCAASFIGDRWALTSAGCLENLRFLYVRLGVSFLPNQEMVINTGLFSQHPNWSSTTAANDIGLVNIYAYPHYDENIQPIALGVGDYNLPSSGYFCGWGATENNTYSDELYCLNVTLVEQDDGTIIGYSTQGKATEFDMGAPLISDDGILIGVVSQWPGDGDDFAAVFSQPRLMIDWISSYSGLTFPENPDVGGEDEQSPVAPEVEEAEEVTDGVAHLVAPLTVIVASVLFTL